MKNYKISCSKIQWDYEGKKPDKLKQLKEPIILEIEADNEQNALDSAVDILSDEIVFCIKHIGNIKVL